MATVRDAHDRVAGLDGQLSIELIRQDLSTVRIGFQSYLFGEVTSTNAVLRRLAEAGAPDGTVVLAETQTAGRGRLGKPWYSPPGVNLYASVLLRPRIGPAAAPVYAAIASLAVADAIAEGTSAMIKWPNDVLVGGRKIAGTLSAYATAGDLVSYVILGVGVNLNVDRSALVAALGTAGEAATSLRAASGRAVDRNAFAATFLNHLEKWDDVYRAEGPEPVLAAWRARDALAGRLLDVRVGSDRRRGRARGIAADGRLLVEDVRGGRCEIATGDVAVIDLEAGAVR